MPESKPVRFGILGCGTASIPVCVALADSPLTELAAVYDVNPELAQDVSQRFQVRTTATSEELLADPTVDAVYVAVPHHLLAPLTRQVLQSGKHALTEKPLGISLEELDSLIALADEKHSALGVFYEMRHAPAFAKARALIQAGAIGNIFAIQIQTLIDKQLSYWQYGYAGRSMNPWRSFKAQAGGGVVLMNSSHLLDALTFVSGLTITSVSAEVETLVANVEVEDTATATLRFSNGAIGSLIAGAHIRGAHQNETCHIYGTEGQIRLPDPYSANPLQLYLKNTRGDLKAGHWHALQLEQVPVYLRAVEDFARAVQSGQCPPIGGRDARYVLSVVLAMYQSAKERKMISVSERGKYERH